MNGLLFLSYKILLGHDFIALRYVDTTAEKSAITTSTNEAYGKVKAEERDRGYELTDIYSYPRTCSPVMYETPLSLPSPPSPSQPLPSPSPTQSLPSVSPSPSIAVDQSGEEETVYDVIPGDQGT